MFNLYSELPHVNEVLYANIFSLLPPYNFSSTNSPSTFSDWSISVALFQGSSRLARFMIFDFFNSNPNFYINYYQYSVDVPWRRIEETKNQIHQALHHNMIAHRTHVVVLFPGSLLKHQGSGNEATHVAIPHTSLASSSPSSSEELSKRLRYRPFSFSRFTEKSSSVDTVSVAVTWCESYVSSYSSLYWSYSYIGWKLSPAPSSSPPSSSSSYMPPYV